MSSSLGVLNLSVFPSSVPIEEEDVLLRCVVDRMLYSSLSWYRVLNVSNPAELPTTVPCSSLSLVPVTQPNATVASLQGPNVTLDLSLPKVGWQDEGLYACRMENADSSERTCLLHNLHLRGENSFCTKYSKYYIMFQPFCKLYVRCFVHDIALSSGGALDCEQLE